MNDKQYFQEMRDVARDIGNCTRCYQHKEVSKFKTCMNCREKAREWRQQQKLKLD